ncbi:unnamed protein product [Colias eurytheme]|nr:unnamed protein product [Colias eurytheme]
MEAINELFTNKVISHRGNINWPPRSPDLSPVDYFVWRYLKSKVYENNPRNLTQLKQTSGDNLASHINPSVLKVCEENNIAFICLPPNATHILQPLDVAYFRPLKIKWRQALLNWKQSQEGRKLPTLPKDKFLFSSNVKLNNLQKTKGQNLGNKLKEKHINFQRQKIK